MNKSALSRHAVAIEGSSENVLIFSHGYGCDQWIWQPILPMLRSVARTVVYDITGAGESDISHFDPKLRHSELDGYATDLIEICDELNSPRLTFVGHSVSAMIGLIAASRRPDMFDSLILIAPSPCYKNYIDYHGGFETEQLDDLLELMKDNFSNWADTITPIIMGYPDRPELAHSLSRGFCRWNEDIAKHFARLTFLSDSRYVLNHVKNDCLIMQCENDLIAPDFVGKYMSEKLASSTLVRLKAQGHCPHVSNPQETAKKIAEYLQHRGDHIAHVA
ncbi:alpha/beta fold hydrolase [Brucella thiophenivorans]|uniref:Alpha/beta hydrolase fold family protein n=1 Tax=Brucella thiophenivorans TaxID=571255 RepID=A0A256FBJ3_9HYPH|nr:alpha/beta hydrolase [Brucella thiophenivorans]OYR12235.1 alpha/beta hydrolase fold family protein [Brucella thiophenivorans]